MKSGISKWIVLGLFISGGAALAEPPQIEKPSILQKKTLPKQLERAPSLPKGTGKSEGATTVPASASLRPTEYYIHQAINCPRPYKVEVTKPRPMPSPWEPSFGSMTADQPSEVLVEAYHGYGLRLQCRYYGHSEQFMLHMAPPADMPECVVGDPYLALVQKPDFVCRPAGDYINQTDEITVEPSYRFSMSHDGFKHFWWRADSATQQSLEAAEGRTYFSPLSATPSYAHCASVTTSSSPQSIAGEALQPGTKWCFRTTNGRLGWFEVLSRPGRGPTGLRIRYVTWSLVR